MIDMDVALIWALAIFLFLLFAIPFFRRKKNIEKRTEEAELEALKYGLKEPATLHPVVDPTICIGSGNCVAICPEEDVLGLRSGQAVTVAPARCVGHGLCERSCPVDAIQLVFGSEKRGVDIPYIQGNFETNVPGVYIIGELGGMGLIRNAFTQAEECISYIADEKLKPRESALDVLIVGCGPAGLSATIHCAQQKLNTVTLEQGEIGGSIRSYPRKKLVMTKALKIPGFGKIHTGEVRKEELIETWVKIRDSMQLDIKTGERVLNVEEIEPHLFKVETNDAEYITQRVVLAIGRRGSPRKLGIEGEELENVAYSLREPDQYQNATITVVGGGDSAVEAALALAGEPGNTVRISYRKERFFRIKPANQQRIQQAIEESRLTAIFNSEVVKNEPEKIHIQKEDDEIEILPNNQLFIFIGGTLPMALLKDLGVKIDTKFGTP